MPTSIAASRSVQRRIDRLAWLATMELDGVIADAPTESLVSRGIRHVTRKASGTANLGGGERRQPDRIEHVLEGKIEMGDLRFDRWTRRRFGLTAGGIAAGFGLLSPARGDSKKKKRKPCKPPRCRTLLQSCAPQSTEQSCCQGLNCDPVSGQGSGLLCCLGRQQPCQASSSCCGGASCLPSNGLSGSRCCGAGGAVCTTNADCCVGFDCFNNACAAVSDRNQKANFGTVDPTDMLQRAREVPITTWNYTFDNPAVRHIGPMAQDFAAAFGVGADDRHIYGIDAQGVALAAIQGLAIEIEQLRAQNDALAARLAAHEADGRHPTGRGQ